MKWLKLVIFILISLASSTQASSLLNELSGLTSEVKDEKELAIKPQNELQTLIAVLKDEQSRQTLIQNLEKVIQAQQHEGQAETTQPSTVNFIISEFLHDLWQAVNDLKKHSWSLVKFMKSKVVQDIFWQLLWMGIAATAAGYGAELLFLKFFQKLFLKMQTRERTSLTKFQIFMIRSMIRLLALFVFTLVTFIALMVFEPQPRVFNMAFITISVIVLLKTLQIISTILLSPRLPALRLIILHDKTALLLHEFLIITAIAIGSCFILSMSLTILHAPREANFFIVKLSTLIIGVIFIYFSGRLKTSVNDWIKREKTD